jgi:hypothetical protein
MHGIQTRNWIIGESISRESYDRFKDGKGNVYVLAVYEKGEANLSLVPKSIWDQAEQHFADIEEDGNQAMERRSVTCSATGAKNGVLGSATASQSRNFGKGAPMSIRPESRAKFEKLGIKFVRQDIIMGHSIQDGLENREAQEWMAEQQRKLEFRESIRYWLMLIFTFIAAVAATIAAWPVVKDWLVVK